MGSSGGMQLTDPRFNGSPTMSNATTNETFIGGGGGVTGDVYQFTYDFSTGDPLTFTGDFNLISGGEITLYDDTSAATIPGTFSVNATDGTFTYSITAAQVAASSGLQHTLKVEGGSGSSDFDEDSMQMTFILCFAAGTQIATPNGETSVEALQIGDSVLTADGRTVPVKWIARTSISPMFNPAERLEPVRIRRDALGPDTPNRDLIVTADHGMILDELVINAGALINGTSIDWYPWKQIGQSLTYYHVETDAHDTILANNTPAETFLDMASRRSFDNFAEYETLYSEETIIPEMDRPRISARRLLPQSIRDRLNIADDSDFELHLATG